MLCTQLYSGTTGSLFQNFYYSSLQTGTQNKCENMFWSSICTWYIVYTQLQLYPPPQQMVPGAEARHARRKRVLAEHLIDAAGCGPSR